MKKKQEDLNNIIHFQKKFIAIEKSTYYRHEDFHLSFVCPLFVHDAQYTTPGF